MLINEENRTSESLEKSSNSRIKKYGDQHLPLKFLLSSFCIYPMKGEQFYIKFLIL